LVLIFGLALIWEVLKIIEKFGKSEEIWRRK
jgi:hypothetical protein